MVKSIPLWAIFLIIAVVAAYLGFGIVVAIALILALVAAIA